MQEHHPYGTYIPRGARSLIIGSFPIGKFSHPGRRHEIKENEFDFFFGGEKNLLWRLLGEVFGVKLKKKDDIVRMLREQGLGVGDVIRSCRRHEGGGSDSDLYDIRWNTELLTLIRRHKIQKLYFTSRQVEKWFDRLFPEARDLERVRLLSPSAQSARSIVRMVEYAEWKKLHPLGRTYDFLLERYKWEFTK